MPDGRRLQSDLYTAFLLRHTKLSLDGFDAAALERDYEHFVNQHDAAVRALRAAP